MIPESLMEREKREGEGSTSRGTLPLTVNLQKRKHRVIRKMCLEADHNMYDSNGPRTITSRPVALAIHCTTPDAIHMKGPEVDSGAGSSHIMKPKVASSSHCNEAILCARALNEI